MARVNHRSILAGAAIAALGAGGAAAAEAHPPKPAPPCTSTALALAQGDGINCMVDDNGTSLGFRMSQPLALGTIETFATFAGQSTNAFTPDRLIASDARRIGTANRVMIGGLKARLLDDRLTVTSQFGWSDYIDRSAPRAELRGGSARMIRADLKLVDRAALRWSVAGELSDVSESFFLGQAIGEGASLAMPGRRLTVSTALGWKRARLTAAHDDYRSRFGTFATTRVGLSRNGVSLSLRSARGTINTDPGSILLSGRSGNHSVTLEVDFRALVPRFAMDERLPAILLPKHLLIGWRGGSSESRFATAADRFERKGFELNGMWETPLGDTSLGLWRDRRIGATAALGQRDEQVFQLSHLVRRGDWRFGVDAMVAESRSTRGSGLKDRTVAIGGSIAYEVAGGPRLMLQLSDDRGRMAADDDSFLTARRGQQVSASLDLTDYLRRRFERDDLRLKIDYRKQLDRSTTEVGAFQQLIDRWTDGQSGEGLLVSFGMKL